MNQFDSKELYHLDLGTYTDINQAIIARDMDVFRFYGKFMYSISSNTNTNNTSLISNNYDMKIMKKSDMDTNTNDTGVLCIYEKLLNKQYNVRFSILEKSEVIPIPIPIPTIPMVQMEVELQPSLWITINHDNIENIENLENKLKLGVASNTSNSNSNSNININQGNTDNININTNINTNTNAIDINDSISTLSPIRLNGYISRGRCDNNTTRIAASAGSWMGLVTTSYTPTANFIYELTIPCSYSNSHPLGLICVSHYIPYTTMSGIGGGGGGSMGSGHMLGCMMVKEVLHTIRYNTSNTNNTTTTNTNNTNNTSNKTTCNNSNNTNNSNCTNILYNVINPGDIILKIDDTDLVQSHIFHTTHTTTNGNTNTAGNKFDYQKYMDIINNTNTNTNTNTTTNTTTNNTTTNNTTTTGTAGNRVFRILRLASASYNNINKISPVEIAAYLNTPTISTNSNNTNSNNTNSTNNSNSNSTNTNNNSNGDGTTPLTSYAHYNPGHISAKLKIRCDSSTTSSSSGTIDINSEKTNINTTTDTAININTTTSTNTTNTTTTTPSGAVPIQSTDTADIADTPPPIATVSTAVSAVANESDMAGVYSVCLTYIHPHVRL